ncbi:FCD domain-containing protein [Saxibacter everestensis]|uniref:FCD domain-containing protein n=1 Tax=Saxibacter everestensis TaxID=2909229 RepID=A0ABY8QUP5_9MICO|nr:FCD domain-containing protein [Brevibacteriaceae bacterium ZFBP1038]
MSQISGPVQHSGSEPGAVAPLSLRMPEPRSRAEQLAEAIDQRIRERGLGPGDPVGTLQSLRQESGYARSTVSEAVRLLRERGILEIRPGRSGGLFVADGGPVVRLRRTLLTVGEQPSAVLDAIELREHLEELIAVGAARCRTAADIEDLRTLLGRMEGAASWDEFMHANWTLHERIAEIVPNQMARAVYIGTLGHLSGTSSRFDSDDPAAVAYRTHRHRVHAELVDAIAAGDLEAVAAAVRAHNTTDQPAS